MSWKSRGTIRFERQFAVVLDMYYGTRDAWYSPDYQIHENLCCADPAFIDSVWIANDGCDASMVLIAFRKGTKKPVLTQKDKS